MISSRVCVVVLLLCFVCAVLFLQHTFQNKSFVRSVKVLMLNLYKRMGRTQASTLQVLLLFVIDWENTWNEKLIGLV